MDSNLPPAYPTPENKIEALRNLVISPLWSEILEPYLREQIRTRLEAILVDGSNVPELRGEIRAYRTLMHWPPSVVAEVEVTKDREAIEAEYRKRVEHIAEVGFGGPIGPEISLAPPSPDMVRSPWINSGQPASEGEDFVGQPNSE